MTEKLYDADPYGREFDALVLRKTEYKGKTGYVFDKTFFFPEEGGQTPDQGSVNGLKVTDVQIKDGEIIHFVEGELTEGTAVHGEIDFEHRFKNMQCHSAEHIFSGLVYSTFGFNNVGFHLSDNSATMDYDGFLSDADIESLEFKANKIITENRKILAEYPDPEILKNLSYRSKKELSGPIRIVTVEGVDVCACCAPHVRLTGEIGVFKVISSEKYKGGTRVNYLAGFRALEDYRQKQDALLEISRLLSVKRGAEAEAVAALINEHQTLKYDYLNIKNSQIADKIKKAKESDPDYLFLIEASEDSGFMDFYAKSARDLFSSFSLFFGNDTEGYKFVIEGKISAKTAADILRNRFAAKCGGRDNSVRGSVNLSKKELEDNFSDLSLLSEG